MLACKLAILPVSHACFRHSFREAGFYSLPSGQSNHISLPHNSFLRSRSSLAIFLRWPHFVLAASCFSPTSLALSSALTTMPTKNWLHPNFSASFTLVHVCGSASLSCLISAISVELRWYFFSYGARTGAGSAVVERGGRREGTDRGVPGAAIWEACRRCAVVVEYVSAAE